MFRINGKLIGPPEKPDLHNPTLREYLLADFDHRMALINYRCELYNADQFTSNERKTITNTRGLRLHSRLLDQIVRNWNMAEQLGCLDNAIDDVPEFIWQ